MSGCWVSEDAKGDRQIHIFKEAARARALRTGGRYFWEDQQEHQETQQEG